MSEEGMKTPEHMRERLSQEERKDPPMVVFKDGVDWATSGNLSELIRALGWKGTLIAVLVIIAALILIPRFF